MMKHEVKDAAMALAVFELWVDGKIDHNVAVPMLFNIPMLDKYRSEGYSDEFLDAFEYAVEYETIRSLMDDKYATKTANRIIIGFKNVILNYLKN